jgi:O-antigen/teichoic acid export membrane protein
VVVSLGLETAVFRGYVLAAAVPERVRAFVGTVGTVAVAVPLLASIAFSLAAAPAVAELVRVPTDVIRLAAIGAAFGASATIVPLALLRAQNRLGSYLRLTALQVVILPALAVAFVWVFRWGATGWMASYAIGNAILLARGLVMVRRDWAPVFVRHELRLALAFGLPLVPHAIAHWGLSVSDRAILGAYVSAADVGAYYAAFLFGLPVALIATALSQAAQPLYAMAAADPERRVGLGRVMTVHALAVGLATAAIALLGPPTILALLPGEYAIAAAVLPWLAVGGGLFGLYLIPMNVTALVVGRTTWVWLITGTAAAVNIGLNLIFVPQFGLGAAAVNTTIGYAALLVGHALYAQRLKPPQLRLEGRHVSAGLAVICVPAAIGAVVGPQDSAGGFIVRVVLLVAAASAVLLLSPWREEARAVIRSLRSADAAGQP